MMLYTKYKSSGPCRFRYFLKIFENCLLKPVVDPMAYLCNQSEPFEQFWKGTISIEFGQIPISGSREDVV